VNICEAQQKLLCSHLVPARSLAFPRVNARSHPTRARVALLPPLLPR
jgi:hypothetical protein